MEEKVSVVIPNFNGQNLLAKNLPKVIETCENCEIIVVDDASTDDSVKYLKSHFKKIKILENKKNLGFARAVNIGAGNASGKFILLLNTDVAPQKKFLEPALAHFITRHHPRGEAEESPGRHTGGELFAVGLADQSQEDGKIIVRGRGGAKFIKGFANHFALRGERAETLWVSGGSGLFSRDNFLDLGGFDPVFSPFYWEDIDLSYRARKQGMICIFEPKAKVDHYHQEGAIKKTHSSFFIKSVSYKNQFIFVWKNISDDILLILHLLWLPYHFLRALVTFDLAFFLGFLWAITKIPNLIFNYPLPTTNLGPQSSQTRRGPHGTVYQLTDKEILNVFK